MIRRLSLFRSSIFILALMLSSCASFSQSQRTTYRTYYESLDLSSPESAVQSFSSAFQKSDFPTVFWILAPEAQSEYRNNIALLEYDYLIKLSSTVKTDMLNNISPIEHRGETSYHFDGLMMTAKEHSAFIIDLSGEIGMKDRVPASNNQYVDLVTVVDGIDGDVVFRLVQSPSKRWRVLQVIVPGGDETLIPWSVPRHAEQ